ncbi:MAG: beta-lactamase family protein, partial [Bacteroidetes bacterium]|nr:beta-lactamase family protein [Bacteroidota bacterium]
MKTLFSKSLVFVSIYLLLSVTIFAQSKVKSIDELMQRYYDYSQFNGTVLVADSVGIVFSKGYGYANLEWNISNDVSTKFRIGSVTKQFTAVLILQLVEAGKIDLNKTISDYLPYYREDNGKRANIHQLLTHTSGIPSYTGLPNFADEISKTKSNPKDFVVKHCSGDFEFEPGSQFLYNNSGYFILGAIIEEVTGKDYATVLKENILVPL